MELCRTHIYLRKFHPCFIRTNPEVSKLLISKLVKQLAGQNRHITYSQCFPDNTDSTVEWITSHYWNLMNLARNGTIPVRRLVRFLRSGVFDLCFCHRNAYYSFYASYLLFFAYWPLQMEEYHHPIVGSKHTRAY